MYTRKNFRTKKELKLAVKERNEVADAPVSVDGVVKLRQLSYCLEVFQPNGDLTNTSAPLNGRVYIEGPHYPEPHRWYAQGEVKDGVLVNVK